MFDASDWTDVACIATTLISAAFVLLVLLNETWDAIGKIGLSWPLIAFPTPPTLCIVWAAYAAIRYVILGATVTKPVSTALLTCYGIFSVLALVLAFLFACRSDVDSASDDENEEGAAPTGKTDGDSGKDHLAV